MKHVGGKVLIADDSTLVRRLLRRVLEGNGFECVEAGDGEEALAIWRAHRPVLVLLDLNMPKLSGYRALEQMRAEDSQSAVIVLSADVQPQARERVVALGARAMVPKSFDKASVDSIMALVSERMAEVASSNP